MDFNHELQYTSKICSYSIYYFLLVLFKFNVAIIIFNLIKKIFKISIHTYTYTPYKVIRIREKWN